MKKNKRSLSRGVQKRRYIIFILSFILFFSFPYALFAGLPQQDCIVKGKVTDIRGQPLPGVTVLLNGSSLGTATDKDGHFALRLPRPDGVLVFSFVGYETQRVAYVAGEPLVVRMQEGVSALDEVLVVAYGSQLKRDAVGAVSSVWLDNALKLPAGTMDKLLQGCMAGVNVDVKGGEMGRGSVTKIRGTTGFSNNPGDELPLYVVDGVPMDARVSAMSGFNPLAELNPSDIESVSVLKDASAAAMYGLRAANGVIIITTRRGKYNQRATVTASVLHSITFRP